MARSVKDGVLQSVSASQINTYRECPRKWWMDKVAGIEQPETTSQAEGTRIHAQFEDYFLKGIEPTHESVKEALALQEVPCPAPDVIIEEPRNYALGLTASGVPVKGRIDLFLPPAMSRFVVIDWKSTKSWKYLKTSEELARNPQGIIYLQYGFTKYPEAEFGLFRHVYARTKGGSGARAVDSGLMTRTLVAEQYAHIEAVVGEMVEAAKLPESDVPYNTRACNNYGGCPYKKMGVCTAVARDLLLDFEDLPTTEETTVTALEAKLASRKALVDAAFPSTAPPAINPPDAAKPDVPVPWNPPVTTATKVPETSEPTSSVGLSLYVDCMPTKTQTPVTNLSDLIAQVTPMILDRLRSASPNDVPKDAVDLREVKYGAGSAALAAYFRRNPPTGHVFASTGGLSGQVVEVLEPLASSVTRRV